MEEYLKGSRDVTLTIWDDSLRSTAWDDLLQRTEGSPFDPEAVGKTYLLFLRSDQDHFRTDICKGSTEIDPDHMPSVIEEIRQIVAGTAVATETPTGAELPVSGTGGGESDGNRAWLVTGVSVVAALGLAGGAAVAWRGARRP